MGGQKNVAGTTPSAILAGQASAATARLFVRGVHGTIPVLTADEAAT